MSDVTADYLALRRSAAWFDLPRDVLRVSGADAVTFLQGQLSADVAALGVGGHTWSLLLGPQGKVDAWLRVTRVADDALVLDVDAGWGERARTRIERFRLRVDATVELLDWRCVAVRGPDAAAVDVSGCGAELVLPVDWRGLPGVDLLGPEVSPPEGIHRAGAEAVASVRVEQGWPQLGAELVEGSIPAEAGQWLIDRSVSFTKGCYTGQELVARIDSRGGATPFRLAGVVLGTNVLPPEGATIVAGGEERGEVTSVGESLDLRAPVALVRLHRSVELPADVELRWGDRSVPATARELPLR